MLVLVAEREYHFWMRLEHFRTQLSHDLQLESELESGSLSLRLTYRPALTLEYLCEARHVDALSIDHLSHTS